MVTANRIFGVTVYHAEEGGYWAEVDELPGCVTQGETIDELVANIPEAIEACLDAGATPITAATPPVYPERWKISLPL